MKALKIRIEGLVQGVGFRYFTQRIAGRYRIKGYVMNMPDGSVLIHAEGDENDLKGFLKEVSRGPSMAVVTNVKVEEVQPENFTRFRIRF